MLIRTSRLILALIPVVAVAALWGSALPVSANGDDHCQSGKQPTFSAGFAELSSRLGDWMGAAVTCEMPDPGGSGDVQQQTEKGLALWRKSSNTAIFTNGPEHWRSRPAASSIGRAPASTRR